MGSHQRWERTVTTRTTRRIRNQDQAMYQPFLPLCSSMAMIVADGVIMNTTHKNSLGTEPLQPAKCDGNCRSHQEKRPQPKLKRLRVLLSRHAVIVPASWSGGQGTFGRATQSITGVRKMKTTRANKRSRNHDQAVYHPPLPLSRMATIAGNDAVKITTVKNSLGPPGHFSTPSTMATAAFAKKIDLSRN